MWLRNALFSNRIGSPYVQSLARIIMFDAIASLCDKAIKKLTVSLTAQLVR
jgi:hypothetical protein